MFFKREKKTLMALETPPPQWQKSLKITSFFGTLPLFEVVVSDNIVKPDRRRGRHKTFQSHSSICLGNRAVFTKIAAESDLLISIRIDWVCDHLNQVSESNRTRISFDKYSYRLSIWPKMANKS